jgi:hypothetical protein
MSRQLDIFKLADDVLASVEEPVVEKVAQEAPDALKTEIGNALKTAAAALRNADPSAVSYEDITAVLSSAKGQSLSKTASAEDAGKLRTTVSWSESKLGHELRNLAESLRKEAASADAARATKAAHAITAAVGIKHLERALSVKG